MAGRNKPLWLTATTSSVLLALVFAGASSSQNQPPFRSNVELVTVPCTVVDSTGVPVRDLSPEEFRIYDNDVRRTIQHFSIDTDLPLTLGIIVDESESQQDLLVEHRRTVLDLVERILRPGDRAFVVSVNDEIRLWVDLTDSMNEIRAQMAAREGPLLGEPCPKRLTKLPGLKPSSVCGSSPLWNAIYEAARRKLSAVKGSKALLILTDGFDSGSARSWRDAADELLKAEATAYAIHYRSGFGGAFAPDLYQLVAGAGGARFPAPEAGYDPIVSRLQNDLRQRYVLGFRPERMSQKIRHDLRVEVTRSNLSVRARRSYFYIPK